VWYAIYSWIIIRLEDRLQPNIRFTLRHGLVVFTRSAVTPPKVNQFGWNLEHSEYAVGGWPGQILSAIRAIASAGEPGEILSFSGLETTRSHSIVTDFPSAKFQEIWTRHVDRCRMETFGTKLRNFYRKGSFCQKRKNFSKRFNLLRLQAAITPQQLVHR